MASGFFKRTMVYLGLVDDDYEDYEDYEPSSARPVTTYATARADELEPVAAAAPMTGRSSAIRVQGQDSANGSSIPRLRPVAADAAARVHVVAPSDFADARQVADRLMDNQPVIINLQAASRDLMRRMIDFCSGATYSLNGKMERVADKVFLVTPSNVKVSAEERQRLQENGLLQS